MTLIRLLGSDSHIATVLVFPDCAAARTKNADLWVLARLYFPSTIFKNQHSLLCDLNQSVNTPTVQFIFEQSSITDQLSD